MPLPDSVKIRSYIETLITKTRRGDFTWKKVNPSTFSWDSGEPFPKARVVLQRTSDPAKLLSATLSGRKEYLHILQALDISKLGVTKEMLKIDGDTDPPINDRLGSLFDLVQTGVTDKGLDFLAELVGSDPATD